MSVGSLRTLVQMLQAAPSLIAIGASVVFGEEPETAYNQPLPIVVVMPSGGTWTMNGYAYGVSSYDYQNIWMTTESIDIYLWAQGAGGAPSQLDNADAVEVLRAAVLQAFQSQQDAGLKYAPVMGTWKRTVGGMSRYGRAYVLTVQVDISVLGIGTVNAPTPITVEETVSIQDS